MSCLMICFQVSVSLKKLTVLKQLHSYIWKQDLRFCVHEYDPRPKPWFLLSLKFVWTHTYQFETLCQKQKWKIQWYMKSICFQRSQNSRWTHFSVLGNQAIIFVTTFFLLKCQKQPFPFSLSLRVVKNNRVWAGCLAVNPSSASYVAILGKQHNFLLCRVLLMAVLISCGCQDYMRKNR